MSLVKVESSEGITTITMTRADKRNALTQELCDGLYDAYRAFEAGSDQVAVLQADGPAFCVGADLKEPPSAMWKTPFEWMRPCMTSCEMNQMVTPPALSSSFVK